MLKVISVLFILVASFSSYSYAEDWFCKTDSKVTSYLQSKDQSQVGVSCVKVDESDTTNYRELITSVPLKFLKDSNGNLVEMTQAEKDAVIAQEVSAREAAEAAAIENFQVTTKEVVSSMLELYNSKVPAGQAITEQELKTKIIANRDR